MGFVEWDAWNRRVLAKHWPEAHVHGDIKTFTAATLRDWGIRTQSHQLVESEGKGPPTRRFPSRPEASKPSKRHFDSGGDSSIDLLTGGYPCQPFSHAGKRLGAEDVRHLWPEMRRVIDLTRPRYILAENVSGHVTMGLDTVLAELEADGYTCGAVVIPACAVNALHRRDRVWILAHRDRTSISDTDRGDGDGRAESDNWWANGAQVRNRTLAGMADTEARGIRRGRPPGHERQPALCGEGMAHAEGDRRARTGAKDDTAQNRSAPGDSGESEGSDHRQTPRALDTRADGVSAGLVRRPAAGPAEPDLIRQAWADGSWELDLPRVVADEPERRQKLQAAGNAIVSVVAYEILRVMLAPHCDDLRVGERAPR